MHMCYVQRMRSQSTAAATRTVVLLKPTERKKLDRLVASQGTSSGEILRRSLRAYDPESSPEDQALLSSMLSEMNQALDRALESISSARFEIRENLEKLELAKGGKR